MNGKKARLIRQGVRQSQSTAEKVTTYLHKSFNKKYTDLGTIKHYQVVTSTISNDCLRYFYKAVKKAYKLRGNVIFGN